MKTGKVMSSKFTSVFAGWFIDGTGKTALNQVMITFHDGLITEVAEKHLETGPDYHQLHGGVMDLSGFTLVPALVDAHVHLFMSGTEDIMIRQHQLEAGFEEIRPVMEEHLSRYLAHGIIAVRDGGDHLGHAMRYKEQCLDFKTAPIFLKVAGKAWNRKGRYGKLIGRFPQEGETLAQAIEKDLAELYPEKPDHIKIVNSGINSLKNFGKQTLPQFCPEEMKEAVRAAADHGLPVMVHANGEEPVKIAVEAGCRSIEHGFFSGEDNLRRMADHGTYWVPTACTMKGYAETLPPDSREAFSARRYLEHQVAQMGLAEKLKVPMAVGTDSGSMGVHLTFNTLFAAAGGISEPGILD
jgi:imidazolonepropionase-like amidohydrolase